MRSRLTIRLTKEALDRVENMRSFTKADSKGAVVRDAIRLYEWLLEQQSKGFKIKLRKGNTIKDIKIIPDGIQIKLNIDKKI